MRHRGLGHPWGSEGAEVQPMPVSLDPDPGDRSVDRLLAAWGCSTMRRRSSDPARRCPEPACCRRLPLCWPAAWWRRLDRAGGGGGHDAGRTLTRSGQRVMVWGLCDALAGGSTVLPHSNRPPRLRRDDRARRRKLAGWTRLDRAGGGRRARRGLDKGGQGWGWKVGGCVMRWSEARRCSRNSRPPA